MTKSIDRVAKPIAVSDRLYKSVRRVIWEVFPIWNALRSELSWTRDQSNRQLATGDLTELDLAAFFSVGFTHHMEIIFGTNELDYGATVQEIRIVQIEAKKEFVVIDAYPGVVTLDMLAKRGRGVKIELVNLRSQNVTSKIDAKEAA